MAKINIRLGTSYALLNLAANAFYVVWGEPLFAVLSPLAFAFIENIAAFVILLCIYGFFPEWRKLRHLSRRKLLSIFCFALCSSVIAPVLFFWGWSLSTPTNTFLLGRAEMIFTILLAVIFLREQLNFQRICGLVLMSGGVYILATGGLKTFVDMQPGDSLLLLSGFFWAVGNIVFKKYDTAVPSELILLIRFTIGSLCLGTAMAFAAPGQINFSAFDLQQVFSLAAYVICSGILGKFLYLKAVRIIPLYLWSTITLMTPIVGLGVNYFFLRIIPQGFHYFGGLLLVLGFIILQIHVPKLRFWHHEGSMKLQPEEVQA